MKKIYAVYNGSFNYLEDIKISPLSRAYTFSDSVYEVIPFFNFKAIAYKKHIHRLQNSCNALGISINIEAISSEITSLIKNSRLENGYIYYQISRGIDALRSHMYEDSLDEETFGYAVEHNFNSQTLKVSLCEDIRWQRCDIKSTSLLGNVLSMNQAKKDGCNEVIMHKSNFITEGGASNILRCLFLALNARDRFCRLTIGGLSLIFLSTVLINLSMVVGIIPVVGMPLPFISKGGSSLLSFYIAFGIIISMASHKKLMQK